jgi:hypothetical protein
MVFRLATAFAVLVLVQGSASADNVGQDLTNQGLTNQDAAAAFSLPAYLRQITDTGGLRSKLEQDGVRFTFSYYGDAFANPVGGVKQGPAMTDASAPSSTPTSKSSSDGRERPFTPAFIKSTALSSAPSISTI